MTRRRRKRPVFSHPVQRIPSSAHRHCHRMSRPSPRLGAGAWPKSPLAAAAPAAAIRFPSSPRSRRRAGRSATARWSSHRRNPAARTTTSHPPTSSQRLEIHRRHAAARRHRVKTPPNWHQNAGNPSIGGLSEGSLRSATRLRPLGPHP